MRRMPENVHIQKYVGGQSVVQKRIGDDQKKLERYEKIITNKRNKEKTTKKPKMEANDMKWTTSSLKIRNILRRRIEMVTERNFLISL